MSDDLPSHAETEQRLEAVTAEQREARRQQFEGYAGEPSWNGIAQLPQGNAYDVRVIMTEYDDVLNRIAGVVRRTGGQGRDLHRELIGALSTGGITFREGTDLAGHQSNAWFLRYVLTRDEAGPAVLTGTWHRGNDSGGLQLKRATEAALTKIVADLEERLGRGSHWLGSDEQGNRMWMRFDAFERGQVSGEASVRRRDGRTNSPMFVARVDPPHPSALRLENAGVEGGPVIGVFEVDGAGSVLSGQLSDGDRQPSPIRLTPVSTGRQKALQGLREGLRIDTAWRGLTRGMKGSGRYEYTIEVVFTEFDEHLATCAATITIERLDQISPARIVRSAVGVIDDQAVILEEGATLPGTRDGREWAPVTHTIVIGDDGTLAGRWDARSHGGTYALAAVEGADGP